MAAIRKKARSTIVQRYELERCLDEQLKLVAALVGGKRPLAGGTPGKPDYRLPKEAQPTPAPAKKTAAKKTAAKKAAAKNPTKAAGKESEERRKGKEWVRTCRSRDGKYNKKKKNKT